MAAGLGTRLRPFTENEPKPMLHVQKKRIITYILNNLRKNNIFKVAINVHYLPESLLEYANKHHLKVFPEKVLLGTAGALLPMKDWLSENFCVLNGDTLTKVNIEEMLDFHKTEEFIATIYSKEDEIHSAGVYIFNKEILQYIPENVPYSIHEDLLPALIKTMPERIGIYRDDNPYIDCGTPQKLMLAERTWRK